jgi:hypothetical protein
MLGSSSTIRIVGMAGRQGQEKREGEANGSL